MKSRHWFQRLERGVGGDKRKKSRHWFQRLERGSGQEEEKWRLVKCV